MTTRPPRQAAPEAIDEALEDAHRHTSRVLADLLDARAAIREAAHIFETWQLMGLDGATLARWLALSAVVAAVKEEKG